ncbi:MAG: hypothetical protein CMB80_04905 [Flammeovirgaceae bacterium]|nr:hypothetical protein [Flammeovirgaceae bacterium]MBE63638.1 hypothetical protein [Flammeovirgaceae bacterium]HCX22554.1 hypothetical protein [Cytophagales bacterium]
MGIGTETPNPNAVLEIVSPGGNQGILIPRYTTAERTATTFTDNLTDAENGLMVFDTDEGALYFWYNGVWIAPSNRTMADLLADNTDAGGFSITNLGSPVDDLDAVTKIYVDTVVSNNAPWSISASNISYNLGNVGVGTDAPISPLQVQDKLHFYHFQEETQGIDGRFIADNLYSDGTTLRNVQDGTGGLIYMSSYGDIEFIHADSSTADTDRFGELSTSLRLAGDLSAEFHGSVSIAGDTKLGGAVYSDVASVEFHRTILDTDHIISLIGTINQIITLPLSSDYIGRELIFIVENVDLTSLNHSIELASGDVYIMEGRTITTPIIMSSNFGEMTTLTLRALGSGWAVINYTFSANG